MAEDTAVVEATELGPGSRGEGVNEIPRPARTAGREAVEKAALPNAEMSDQEAHDAASWLLASFREELPPAEHDLSLNVGSLSNPRWIDWKVQAVPKPIIDKLREETLPSQNRSMRRAGAAVSMSESQAAQWKLDVKLVIAGTIVPNIRTVSASTGLGSPEEFINDAFRNNSGLVSMISSAILTLSGYDEDNIKDVVEGAATGNS